MTEDFKNKLIQKHQGCNECPSNEDIKHLFEDIMSLLFPDFSEQRLDKMELIDQRIVDIKKVLTHLFVHHPSLCSNDPEVVADKFISKLEAIEAIIQMDVNAIYKGDPAAKSKEEVIRSYPGFYAIAAYRIAHELHQLGVLVIPRIITEHAHHRTGIDIHPAATIDHSFCIDHGTGVVIGETTVIGHNVKIYQGVTLGALSVNKEDANSKRHPTIEPHVVIYANATILGGETIIGHNSIIGGNVWITKSVEAHSTIYYIAGDNQIEKVN
ncbi:MAG: serine acetyltransferase [Bacteroidota bacterium]